MTVSDITNPFYTEVIKGAESVVAKNGYRLLIGNTDGDVAREDEYLTSFIEHGVHGVILTVGDTPPNLASYLPAVRRIVLLDVMEQNSIVSSVSVDNELGGYMAAAHLLRQGHRRLTFVNGPSTFPQGRERRKGVIRALNDHGLSAEDLDELVLPIANDVAAEAAMTDRLQRPDLPHAVFCVSDFTAFGVLRAIARAGLVVPDDIAVIGYDDLPYSKMLHVPLSSIRQPARALGESAVELILQKKLPSGAAQHVQFRPELILRESTSLVSDDLSSPTAPITK